MISFWNRFTRVKIGELIIDNSQLEIQFKVKSAPEASDEAEIIIYNISDWTKQNLYPKAPISIESGYKDSYGVIHVGNLWEYYDEFDGSDIKTTIISHSMLVELSDKKLAKTYPAGTRKLDAAKDQVAAALLVFVKIDDSSTDVYTRAKTFTDATSCKQNVEEIGKEIGYILVERKGGVIFIPKNTGVMEGFVLNSETGLLACKKMVQQTEEATDTSGEIIDTDVRDFEVTTLMIYQLAIGSIIQLDSRISGGKKLCRIEELSLQSTGSEHTCTAQLKIT